MNWPTAPSAFGRRRELDPGTRRRRVREEGARGALIAAASTVLFFGVAIWRILESETWPQVQRQFFNPEAFVEVWPAVVSGFWLDVQMFLGAQVLILFFALLVAMARAL
ncbi:MAG TPA: hypothetical protein VK969_05675, partial [Acidimicrobiia bacterium]|nr:hypothetical protein [Acidimicrobiia bacterium]